LVFSDVAFHLSSVRQVPLYAGLQNECRDS
jgi:hypothetical protein